MINPKMFATGFLLLFCINTYSKNGFKEYYTGDLSVIKLDGYSQDLLQEITTKDEAISTLILFDVDNTLIYRTIVGGATRHICQPIVPAFVSKLKRKKYPTLALTRFTTDKMTSRLRQMVLPWIKLGIKNIFNRYQELFDEGITFSNFKMEQNEGQIFPENQDEKKYGPIDVISKKEGIEYYKGIIATNLSKKGVAIKKFLELNPSLRKRIKKIIFFDDKYHYGLNVINSLKMFVKDPLDPLKSITFYHYNMPVNLNFVDALINP